jgi:glyoxalase family protein
MEAEQPRRLSISGIHHITLICKSLERSSAFYRNLLGMRMVKQTSNEDDRDARHLFFGDDEANPGTLITCLEYPQLEDGKVGVGSTHHFALTVADVDELEGWREYLTGQGVACTAVMDRTTLPKVVMPARDRFVKDNRTGGKVVK